MITVQVQLSEWERRAIQALSKQQGKTQEEILHEAIKQFLTQHKTGDQIEPVGKFKNLRGISTVNISTDEVMDLTREP